MASNEATFHRLRSSPARSCEVASWRARTRPPKAGAGEAVLIGVEDNWQTDKIDLEAEYLIGCARIHLVRPARPQIRSLSDLETLPSVPHISDLIQRKVPG